jgi:S1-C subfamily serine protease
MGMNVAYIPPAAAAVSIGFAIPASTVTTVADALIEGREVRHAYLGVRYGPVTPELAERYSLGVEQGLYVLEVAPDSPAAAAGIQPGDVITSVADEPTRSVEDLISILRRFAPGETVEVSIIRGGEETVLEVVLGER